MATCTSGGRFEVSKGSTFDEGQGEGSGARMTIPESPLITDLIRDSEVPLGVTGVLPREKSGTSGSIQKEKRARNREALKNLTNIPESSQQFILISINPNRKLNNINPFEVKAEIDNVCGRINKLKKSSVR